MSDTKFAEAPAPREKLEGERIEPNPPSRGIEQ